MDLEILPHIFSFSITFQMKYLFLPRDRFYKSVASRREPRVSFSPLLMKYQTVRCRVEVLNNQYKFKACLIKPWKQTEYLESTSVAYKEKLNLQKLSSLQQSHVLLKPHLFMIPLKSHFYLSVSVASIIILWSF